MAKAQTLGPLPDVLPPGGMTQDALREELIGEFEFDPTEVGSMKWIDLINEVGHQRHTRQAYGIKSSRDSTPVQQEEDMFEDDEITQAVEQLDTDKIFIGLPGVKDYIFDGHMGASPSGAERWITCTASVGATRAFLETLTENQQRVLAKAGSAAQQGTTAHAAAEAEANLLLGRITEEEVEATLMELTIEPPTEGEAYDEEMAEFITEYTDLIRQYHQAGREVLIEQRVTAWVPLMTLDDEGEQDFYGIAGSGDCIALPSEDEPVLDVVDLKYGDNIWVEPEENPQVRIYALGALSELTDDDGNLPRIDQINYVIAQPRLGGIKTWSESVDDLLDWRDEVLTKALTEALGGVKAGAAFRPSKQACHWCPARGTCSALAEFTMEQAADLFEMIGDAEFEDGPGAFPETTSLSNERLGEIHAQVKGLVDLLADLKEETQRRLHRGERVPGFKLVSYTPARQWQEEAADHLDEETSIWKPASLMTPTQAIKALASEMEGDTIKEREAAAAEYLADWIDVPDKRPIVAPEGDRRKDWTGKPPEQMFEIEGGE